MPSFCPGCRLTFEDKDLAAGPADTGCPRCDGPLQPIKRNVLSPEGGPAGRERSFAPTAPATSVIEPRSAPSFTDNLTPTAPRGQGAKIDETELEEDSVIRQDEPTMPGGALPEKPPGPTFMRRL